MAEITFFGSANEEGEFVHEAPDLFKRDMERLSERAKRLVMKVKEVRKTRSVGGKGEGNQNGYYWAVIVRMIADEIGEVDQQEVHDWLQVAVGNTKTMPNGIQIPAGTSHMDTLEAEEYYKRVRMWAAAPGNLCEAGFFIPLPNETDYE